MSAHPSFDALSLYRVNGRPYLVTIAGEAGNQQVPNLPPTRGSVVVAYTLNPPNTLASTTLGQPTPAPTGSARTESGQMPGSGASAPYTPAQVATGKSLFAQKCASCHGAALQGVSAPALTGAAFGHSNLTISQLRTIVTTQGSASRCARVADTVAICVGSCRTAQVRLRRADRERRAAVPNERPAGVYDCEGWRCELSGAIMMFPLVTEGHGPQ